MFATSYHVELIRDSLFGCKEGSVEFNQILLFKERLEKEKKQTNKQKQWLRSYSFGINDALKVALKFHDC